MRHKSLQSWRVQVHGLGHSIARVLPRDCSLGRRGRLLALGFRHSIAPVLPRDCSLSRRGRLLALGLSHKRSVVALRCRWLALLLPERGRLLLLMLKIIVVLGRLCKATSSAKARAWSKGVGQGCGARAWTRRSDLAWAGSQPPYPWAPRLANQYLLQTHLVMFKHVQVLFGRLSNCI